MQKILLHNGGRLHQQKHLKIAPETNATADDHQRPSPKMTGISERIAKNLLRPNAGLKKDGEKQKKPVG
ncbi:hypothetical protein OFM15_33610, partial [Escherichia coli]|nr:hypothetical protein [Escherichia coli]